MMKKFNNKLKIKKFSTVLMLVSWIPNTFCKSGSAMKLIKSIVLFFILVFISVTHVYSEIYGSVSGIVTEEETGKVVHGMNVFLYGLPGLDNYEGITNKKGEYFIKKVKPGKYEIAFCVISPYCMVPFEVISIESGKNCVYNKTVKIGGTIRGKVINRDSKSPIPEVEIYTYGLFAGMNYDTTKEDGSFVLGSEGGLCPSNLYYVRAKHKDPNIAYKTINGVSVKKGIETKIEDIIFDLNDPTGIEGYVTSSLDGKPLNHVSIYITSADKNYSGKNEKIRMGEVETDCNGYYYIKNLEPGKYFLFFFPDLKEGANIDESEETMLEIDHVFVYYGGKTKINTVLNVPSLKDELKE